MFTTLTGAVLYVLALFPGVAFAFSREGHRPVGKRTAVRELSGIIGVSAFCDALVALAIVGISFAWAPFHTALGRVVAGDSTYLTRDYRAIFLVAVAAVAAATLLGWWLGGPTAGRSFVNRLLTSKIDRDSSGWGVAFDMLKNEEGANLVPLIIGAQLKSGAYVQGPLHTFNNAGDDEAVRSIVLAGQLKHRAAGSATVSDLSGFGSLVLASTEIDYLLVAYPPKTSDGENVADG